MFKNFSPLLLYSSLPGVGKKTTLLQNISIELFEGEPFLDHKDFHYLKGDSCSVDNVRQEIITLDYKPMYKKHRVLFFEDVNKTSPLVQDTLLLFLENVPEHVFCFMTADSLDNISPTLLSRVHSIFYKGFKFFYVYKSVVKKFNVFLEEEEKLWYSLVAGNSFEVLEYLLLVGFHDKISTLSKEMPTKREWVKYSSFFNSVFSEDYKKHLYMAILFTLQVKYRRFLKKYSSKNFLNLSLKEAKLFFKYSLFSIYKGVDVEII